jgi:uncharacterized SAM-dependent methyltransferase
MNIGDKIVLGADLKKAKEIILPAYNDKEGVTSLFNLNLLERINRELGGKFNLNTFRHLSSYDEKEGAAYSYLESAEDQEIEIKELGNTYSFKKNEKIYTEISRKYDDNNLERILSFSGLKIVTDFVDDKGYFKDYILEKV